MVTPLLGLQRQADLRGLLARQPSPNGEFSEGFYLKEQGREAGEMAQLVEALAARVDDLSLLSITCMMEGVMGVCVWVGVYT